MKSRNAKYEIQYSMKTSLFLLISTALVMISCSPGELKKMEADASAAEPVAALASAHTPPDLPVPGHDTYAGENVKLIKTADYRFEVANVKTSTEAIETAIRKYPAYISGSNLRLADEVLENSISIRIQSEFFHDLLKDIDGQALFVNHREVKTADVSKEFVDLESRLKTKREVEARYSAILRSKAGTVEELFEAESKIGALHEEIEATISRMNFLKSQVSYSTINLEYYQKIAGKIAASGDETTSGQFIKAIATGWRTTLTVIIALTYLWPFFVIAAIVATIYFLRHKKAPVA